MGDTWQSEGAPIVIGQLQPFAIGGTTRSSDFHRMAAIVRDLFDARGAITIGGSPSDGANTSWKNSTIAVRSNRDRAAIVARSIRDRTSFITESIHDRQMTFPGASGARSTPDHSPIVARLWSIVAKIVASFEANLKQNRG